MTEKITDLSQWHSRFHKPRSVLMPEVMPVEIDSSERRLRLRAEPLIADRFLPVRFDAVRLQDRYDPSGSDASDWFTDLIAKDIGIVWLIFALGV